MKYYFSIQYQGEINSTAAEDAMEDIGHITDLVQQSFVPDLQAGIVLQGTSINVNQMTEPTSSSVAR